MVLLGPTSTERVLPLRREKVIQLVNNPTTPNHQQYLRQRKAPDSKQRTRQDPEKMRCLQGDLRRAVFWTA